MTNFSVEFEEWYNASAERKQDYLPDLLLCHQVMSQATFTFSNKCIIYFVYMHGVIYILKSMASRKRKAQLPPWLQGVTVKKNTPSVKTVPVEKSCAVSKPVKDAEPKLSHKHALGVGQTLSVIQKSNPPEISNRNYVPSPVNDEQKLTVEKAVEMSYDEFCFKGSIIYSHNANECNILCDDIISSVAMETDLVVGFDTEWPVTYQKGKQAKTALIQICASVDKCYLFHVSCMPKFPVMLKKLLEMKNIKKVGLNIENDFWKLDVDFDIKSQDIIKNSIIELKTLANKKLRSAENWSLAGLSKNALRLRIGKDEEVRQCDWSQFPLPELHQRYAATDAIISLMLYQKLIVK
ncbi:hypothetical protein ACF0H5_011578 [Mactra antiquata]